MTYLLALLAQAWPLGSVEYNAEPAPHWSSTSRRISIAVLARDLSHKATLSPIGPLPCSIRLHSALENEGETNTGHYPNRSEHDKQARYV